MNNKPIPEIIFDLVMGYKLAIRSALKANELGLNGMHVRCLSFIYDKSSCSANDIVNYFALDKSQVARLIKDMVAYNWLIKKPNPKDKRSNVLSLTEQGIELAEVLVQAQKDLHVQMEKNLTTEEIQEFKRVAMIFKENLEV